MAAPVGVVTSLEASALETVSTVTWPPTVFSCFDRWCCICCRAGNMGVACLPMSTLSLVVKCHRLAVVWLLAADHGAWCCLAIVSAVRDCVVGRCLRHRQLVLTWSAANRGGLCSTWLYPPGAIHHQKDGADNILGFLA
jgi:hypothetical protein